MPGIRNTLKEYKERKLHSGSKNGPLVRSRDQAIAIAMSEERAEKGEDSPAEEMREQRRKPSIGKALGRSMRKR